MSFCNARYVDVDVGMDTDRHGVRRDYDFSREDEGEYDDEDCQDEAEVTSLPNSMIVTVEDSDLDCEHQSDESADSRDVGQLNTFKDNVAPTTSRPLTGKNWPLRFRDYLPSYLHPLNKGFQKELSAKREFAMLHSKVGEKVQDGDLFTQQKFVRQFLSQYDRLFMMSEPGTGKTCSVISFCEYVIRLKRYNIANSLSKIKKFYIVVRSGFHVDNIKNMIYKVCSGPYYNQGKRSCRDSKRCRTEPDNADLERRRAYSAIKFNDYSVVTYRGLAKMLKQSYLDKNPPNLFNMREFFSDSLVWVDEAHNVALPSGALVNRSSVVKEETYWAFHKLFHEVDRIKVVLSTATPMLNEAGEIMSLINLLRPADSRPPQDWDWRRTDDATFAFRFPGAVERGLRKSTATCSEVSQYFVGQMNPRIDVNKLTLDDLENHFRGLFVYSRQDPVGVEVVYVGTISKANQNDPVSSSILRNKGGSRTRVHQTTMSSFQGDQFDMVYDGLSTANPFYQLPRNVSNFVFPNGNVEDGFDRYMQLSSGGHYKATQEFDRLLSDMDNVREYSCKFHSIIDNCTQLFRVRRTRPRKWPVRPGRMSGGAGFPSLLRHISRGQLVYWQGEGPAVQDRHSQICPVYRGQPGKLFQHTGSDELQGQRGG